VGGTNKEMTFFFPSELTWRWYK